MPKVKETTMAVYMSEIHLQVYAQPFSAYLILGADNKWVLEVKLSWGWIVLGVIVWTLGIE